MLARRAVRAFLERSTKTTSAAPRLRASRPQGAGSGEKVQHLRPFHSRYPWRPSKPP